MIHKILPRDVKKQWGVAILLVIISAVFLGDTISSSRFGLGAVIQSIPAPTRTTETFSKDGYTLTVPATGMIPSELAIVIDEDSSISNQAGDYYVDKWGIPASNVVKIRLSNYSTGFFSNSDTDRLYNDVARRLQNQGAVGIRGFLLVWSNPYNVSGQSVTHNFGSKEGVIKPTMLLTTAPDKKWSELRNLIDRSFEASQTENLNPEGGIYFHNSSDHLRSQVRDQVGFETDSWNGSRSQYAYFMKGHEQIFSNFQTKPNDQEIPWQDLSDVWTKEKTGLQTKYIQHDPNNNQWVKEDDIMFYFTGTTHPDIEIVNGEAVPFNGATFLRGAIGDHITSIAGILGPSGQVPTTVWLKGGASASNGTIEESNGNPKMYPDVGILITNYFQGMTASEAMNSAVVTKPLSLMVGDPLARPFGTKITKSDSEGFAFETTILKHTKSLTSSQTTGLTHVYRIYGSNTPSRASAVLVRPDGYNTDEIILEYPEKVTFTFTGDNLYSHYWLEVTNSSSNIVIVSPKNGGVYTTTSPSHAETAWNPYIYYGGGGTFYYKYEYDNDFISLASAGYKIPPPRSEGQHTLTVKSSSGKIASSTFTYSPKDKEDVPPQLISFTTDAEAYTDANKRLYRLGENITITANFNKPLSDSSRMTIYVNTVDGIRLSEVNLTKSSAQSLSGIFKVGVNAHTPEGLNVYMIKNASVSDLDGNTKMDYYRPIHQNIRNSKFVLVNSEDESFKVTSPERNSTVSSWDPSPLDVDWGGSQICSYRYQYHQEPPTIFGDIPCSDAGTASIPQPPTRPAHEQGLTGLILEGWIGPAKDPKYSRLTTKEVIFYWRPDLNNTPPRDVTAPIIISRTTSSVDDGKANLTIETDENATCKYSTSNTTYTNMNLMSSTGVKNHSQSLTLAPGNHTYYVKCMDTASNINENGYPISFTFQPPVDVAPVATLKSSSFTRVRQNQRDAHLTNRFTFNLDISSGSNAITIDPKSLTHSLADGNGNKVTRINAYSYTTLGNQVVVVSGGNQSSQGITIPANTTANLNFTLNYRIESVPKSTGAILDSVKYKVGAQTRTLSLNYKANPQVIGTLPKPLFSPLPAETNLLTHDLYIATSTVYTGYFVREGINQYPYPLPTDSGWVATPPASHTFSQEGYRAIYVWTKDQYGNISKPEGYGLNIDTSRSIQEEESEGESEPEARKESWMASLLEAILGVFR